VDVVDSEIASCCFFLLLFFHKQNNIKPIITVKRTPPRTPATIVPIFDVGGSVVGKLVGSYTITSSESINEEQPVDYFIYMNNKLRT
jgi:hypothetical protein